VSQRAGVLEKEVKVCFTLSCGEAVKPEAEYAVTTCLAALGFFFTELEAGEQGVILSYGELSRESLCRIANGQWVVRIEHDPDSFVSMVERSAVPRIEGMSVNPAGLPILGRLSGKSSGAILKEAQRSDGARFPLVSEERTGKGGVLVIHFDILAGVFFFLSRIEEAIDGAVDSFGRFPQEELLCAREGFQGEPVVNGYMEILKETLLQAAARSGICLVRKLEWPGGERLCVSLTHDVDRLARWRGRSILKGLLAGRARCVIRSLIDVKRDPWWNLESIQAAERAAGVRSSFFFFADRGGSRGGRYDVLALKDELEDLVRGGWEIGLHGSYDSMVDLQRLEGERERLGQALSGQVTGVRQHYLRIKVPLSVGFMEDTGFGYDASLGFSDRVGFRASTCLPFRLYDFANRRPFRLLEIPITVMDGALPGTPDATREVMKRLLGTVSGKSGLFSLIWHQRSFTEEDFPGLGSLYGWFLEEAGNHHPYFATHEDVFNWWTKRETLGLRDTEKRGRRITASFNTPSDLPSMTLLFSRPIRLREVRGAVEEKQEDPRRLRLQEMARPDFSLIFEENDV
jgi:hypothetical protein